MVEEVLNYTQRDCRLEKCGSTSDRSYSCKDMVVVVVRGLEGAGKRDRRHGRGYGTLGVACSLYIGQ